MHKGESNGTRILKEETITKMHQMETSGWFIPTNDMWLGWEGSDGDTFGFHTKIFTNQGRNTTAPYGVITFVNQEFARDECLAITQLIQKAVHRYDEEIKSFTSPGFILLTFLFTLSSLGFLGKKQSN
jgi:hypothetical protein